MNDFSFIKMLSASMILSAAAVATAIPPIAANEFTGQGVSDAADVTVEAGTYFAHVEVPAGGAYRIRFDPASLTGLLGIPPRNLVLAALGSAPF
jgi:hypothetical protein